MSARKYRQRGYMDEEPRERAPAERRERRDGPGGRGLGAPTEDAFKCARCGAETAMDAEFAADAVCRSCGDDLHSCVNCRHFDTSAPKECRAGVEERIAAKSKRNECSLFEPKIVQGFGSETGEGDPRKSFDALFDF